MPDLHTLTLWLQANPGWISCAIFLIAFVESLALAGVIVPGVIMLFMVSIIAGGGALSLAESLLWAFLGAVGGDGLSFLIGHYFKSSIPRVWPMSRYPALLHSGEEFFRRHGGKSILIGRFVGPLRPVLPLVAGMLHMPARRFLTFNILSAVGWAPLYVIPGFLVGASINVDIPLPEHFMPIMIVSLAIASGLFALIVRLHWEINPGGQLYLMTHQWLMRYHFGRRLWRALATPDKQETEGHTNDKSTAGGEFPLSSFLLVLFSLLSFIILSLIVLHTPWLKGLDTGITNFFQLLRSPVLDYPLLGITLLGDDRYLYWVMPLFIGLLAFRGFYAAAIHVALAGIATALITHGLKDAFALVRPDLALFPPKSFSFPSGHSSGSMVFWGLMGAFVAREVSIRQRWVAYLACALPVALIGVSRIYLGVHWFTDVIGGVLLGLIICGVTRLSYSRFDKQHFSVDISTLIALSIWILLSVVYVNRYFDAAQRAYQPKTNITATMACHQLRDQSTLATAPAEQVASKTTTIPAISKAIL